MSPERWRHIESLFAEAAERSPEERAAFLDAACVDAKGQPDADLRAEVEALLTNDDSADDFFAHLGDAVQRTAEADTTPTEIGPYRIVREIGRGGMGTVYLAERADGQYTQTVALKLVRPGLSPERLSRFRAERQILAGLSHPNIARLLDGGLAPDGRPYLVMEYVEGEPITQFADRQRLDVPARLALFNDVCAAVSHAHRNLVVHRDLKPSNVLVSPEGTVKLLDFGIAKLLDEDAAITLIETQDGQRLMTPAYAAPEQILGQSVTTTTDVYALGVLLYELLTGHRPYRLPDRVRHAVERAILEEEPTEPSTVVVKAVPTLGGAPVSPEAVAAARATEPTRLKRRLQGDLDRIVLMALRKEPSRRYSSVEAFGRDVERHLTGLPVEARPASAGYRLTRFVRRHRVGVAMSAAVLLGALTLGTLYTVRVTAERDRARTEAARAEAVTDFLVGLFRASSPSEAQGDTLTVREVLDRGALRVDRDLISQPRLRATMQEAIGRVYGELALFPIADSLLSEALALRRASLPDGHPDIAESLFHLAELRYAQGDVTAADSILRLVLPIQRRTLPPNDLRLARTVNQLGVMARRQSRYDDAYAFYDEALAMRRAQSDTSGIAQTLHDSAIAHYSRGEEEGDRADLEVAADLFREALALRLAILGPRHPDTNNTRSNLGLLLSSLGELDDAERLLREGLAIEREVNGPTHPIVAARLYQLAYVTQDQGNLAETERLLREAVAIRIGQAGEDGRRRSLGHRMRLADVIRMRQRYADAESMARSILVDAEAVLPDGHSAKSRSRRLLGRILVEGGNPAEAEAHLRQAIAEGEEALGRALARRDLGRAIAALGQRDEGRRLLQAAVDTLKTGPIATDPDLRTDLKVAEDALAALGG